MWTPPPGPGDAPAPEFRRGTSGLVIAQNGDGFVRVLNGALLETASLITNDGMGNGNLHVVGSGAWKFADLAALEPPGTFTFEEYSGMTYALRNGVREYRIDERGYAMSMATGRYVPILEENTHGAGVANAYRTQWINRGEAVLGLAGGGRSTIRINAGGYGETRGLYIGLAEHSEGTVSVTGAGSELHVFSDVNPNMASLLAGDPDLLKPKGSSSVSVSNNAFVRLHENAVLMLNGNAVFSTGSTLHLDAAARDDATGTLTGAALLDAMSDQVKFVNARIEGDGTITGQAGVAVIQDDIFTVDRTTGAVFGQAVIDPGQRYYWATTDFRDESPLFYGTLTFGDQLRMMGNVRTLFDVNSGMDMKNTGGARIPDQDRIIVERGENALDPEANMAIVAELSGTLEFHARLTDYYEKYTDRRVVETRGDTLVAGANGAYVPGRILSKFDNLELLPTLFFTDRDQVIVREVEVSGGENLFYWQSVEDGEFYRELADGTLERLTEDFLNEHLYVTMTRDDTPFSRVGRTFNQRQVGGALDSIYQEMIGYKELPDWDNCHGQDWLPFLRDLWYYDADELRAAMSKWGGEVRAHTLRMPLRNPWNYIVDRVDLRRATFAEWDNDPCGQVDLAESSYVDLSCSRFARFVNRVGSQLRRAAEGSHVWGSYINATERAASDGNASGYQIFRDGIVVGIDRNIKDVDTWVGVMFAFSDGRLRTNISDYSGARVDDFNFGLYHRTRVGGSWEWKSYLGTGYQRYNMWRSPEFGLVRLPWNHDAGFYEPDIEEYRGANRGQFRTKFNGYSMALSTELARPMFFGETDRFLLRPYMALDVNGFWQGAASECPYSYRGNAPDFLDVQRPVGRYLALDYHRTSDIRAYWRPGLHWETAGPRGNFRANVAYSFRTGGRAYSSVRNQFQYGGDSFRQRGVDDGIGFVTLNIGTSRFLDQKRTSLALFDYWVFSGGKSTTQAVQLGAQKKF